MELSPRISLTEYLSTSYETDCDFVDGVTEERNCGTLEHSELLGQLLDLLVAPPNHAHIKVNLILRLRPSATRIRVADVCVRRRLADREQTVRQTPLLCIEVLSPDDTVVKTSAKVRDFLGMGIPEVWLVDPDTRTVTICMSQMMTQRESGTLQVPQTPIFIALADIFKVLDEY